LKNVVFRDNIEATALMLSYSTIDSIDIMANMVNCRFINNKRTDVWWSGAIYSRELYSFNRPIINITGCEFSQNTLAIWSSGDASMNITNCTFGDNGPRNTLTFRLGATAKIYNSILYDQCSWEIDVQDPSDSIDTELEIYNTLIKNDINGIRILDTAISIHYDTQTCFDHPPSWVETGPYPYYLQDDSYAIDTGTLNLPEGVELPEFDIAGGVRVYGDKIDLGAYEYIGPVRISQPGNTLESAIQVFPNPSTGDVTIRYYHENPGKVSLKLYDVNGVSQDILLDSHQPAGTHEIKAHFNPEPGIYFITLQSDSQNTKTVKLLIR
jgi:hypothetical protein